MPDQISDRALFAYRAHDDAIQVAPKRPTAKILTIEVKSMPRGILVHHLGVEQ